MPTLLDVYRRLYDSERKYIAELLKRIYEVLEDDKIPLVFFEAPTGYGKTSIAQTLALYSLLDMGSVPKVIHVLPSRSIVDDVLRKTRERFRRLLRSEDGNSINSLVAGQSMDHSDVVFLDAPYTVTTFDTFLLSSLKLNPKMILSVVKRWSYGYDHYTLGSIYSSFIVFDEIQYVLEYEISQKPGEYSPYTMMNVFLGVVSVLAKNAVPMVFMSATIPKVLYDAIHEMIVYRGCGALKKVKYEIINWTHHSEDFSPDYDRDRPSGYASLSRDSFVPEDRVLDLIKDYLDYGKRVLVVRNTPRRAIKTYFGLRELGYDCVLIHGRLTPKDRGRALERLEKSKVIVSTQVIEAGVDISADVLITDPAPASSIIQRAGRIARYRREERGDVYVLKGEETLYAPYDKNLVERSVGIIAEKTSGSPLDLHAHETIINLLEGAYKDIKRPYFASSAVEKIMISPQIRSKAVLEARKNFLKKGEPFIRELLITCYIVPEEELSDVESLYKNLGSGVYTDSIAISYRDLMRLYKDGSELIVFYPNHDSPKDSKILEIGKAKMDDLVEDLLSGEAYLLSRKGSYEEGIGPGWLLYE